MVRQMDKHVDIWIGRWGGRQIDRQIDGQILSLAIFFDILNDILHIFYFQKNNKQTDKSQKYENFLSCSIMHHNKRCHLHDVTNFKPG